MSVADELRGWVPRWWRGQAGAAGAALTVATAPAELAFRAVVRGRNVAFDRRWRRIERVPCPVISVGNLTVGGTGKTPVAAWLAAALKGRGAEPAVVARDYCVDEIAVHRELNPEVPVVSARRLVHAARVAADRGAECIVVDDGFQHRRLYRDLDVALIATEQWTDERKLLPRGPWREPLDSLARAGLVLVTRKVASLSAAASVVEGLRGIGVRVPVGMVVIAPAGLKALHERRPAVPLEHLGGKRVLAVASLADPGPFFQILRTAGAVVEAVTFPDHHAFDAREMAAILERAGDRMIVMTRKEAVKLRDHVEPDAAAYFLEQTVTIESGLEEVDEAVNRVLER